MVITKQKPIVETQKKEKGIKTYHYGKSSNHKGRQRRGFESKAELQETDFRR